MVPVAHRDANTFIPIIQEFVIPGTTIVSDLRGAYNQIGANGYQHLTVNHSVNFVNPFTFANTNTVENFWISAKYPFIYSQGLDYFVLHFEKVREFRSRSYNHQVPQNMSNFYFSTLGQRPPYR